MGKMKKRKKRRTNKRNKQKAVNASAGQLLCRLWGHRGSHKMTAEKARTRSFVGPLPGTAVTIPRVIEAPETSSRCGNLQRTAEQDFVEVDKTILEERISGRMGIPIKGHRSAQDLVPGKVPKSSKVFIRSEFLNGGVNRARSSE